MSSEEDDFWEDDFSQEEQQQRALYEDIKHGLNHIYDDDFYSRIAYMLAKLPKSAFYSYLSFLAPKKIAKMDLLTRDWAVYFSGFKYYDPKKLVRAAILGENFELLSFLYNEQATAEVLRDKKSSYYAIKIDIATLERNTIRSLITLSNNTEAVPLRQTGAIKSSTGLQGVTNKKLFGRMAKKIKKQLQTANTPVCSVAIEIWKYPGLSDALIQIGVVPHYVQVSDRLRFQLRLLGSKLSREEAAAWTDAFSEKPPQYIFWTLYRDSTKFVLNGEDAYLLALSPKTISKSGNILINLSPTWVDRHPLEQLPFFVKKIKSRLEIPRPYFAVSKRGYKEHSRVYFNEPESSLFLSYKQVYYAYNLYEALLTLSEKVSASKELVTAALKEITINHRYLIRQYWSFYNKNLEYTLTDAYYFFGLFAETPPEEEFSSKVYLGDLISENSLPLEEPTVQEALQAAGQELGYDLIFMQNYIGPLTVVSAIYDCRVGYDEHYLYKM